MRRSRQEQRLASGEQVLSQRGDPAELVAHNVADSRAHVAQRACDGDPHIGDLRIVDAPPNLADQHAVGATAPGTSATVAAAMRRATAL
jgi:hypothetical protein